VKKYAGPRKGLVKVECLYRFNDPVSPHLAVSMAAEKKGAQVSQRARSRVRSAESIPQNVIVPTDDEFVASVASYIRKCASGLTERSHMYIETAGGETLSLFVGALMTA
jgi:bifunctional dethiobiotin synthetase / adenosylmethionine---8-amino-7-oxononanoate aminotransferase